ncbi:MAG: hypothetical protein GX457_12905 [Thermotogaceae bacterium]|nr:hypothetical protein [Thermotogaceae bacterium]
MRINGVELQLIEAGLTSVRNNCSKRAATKRRNQYIFRTRYGITNPPMTLMEVGKRYNLSAEQVRQICEAVVWALHKEEGNIPGLKEALSTLQKEVNDARKRKDHHPAVSTMWNPARSGT